MNIKTFWESLSPALKKSLAARCETSVAYLSQVANSHRQAGRDLCFLLERETKGVVTVRDLRPDWFGPPTPNHGPDHRSGTDRRHHERREGDDRRKDERRSGERRQGRVEGPDRRKAERRSGEDRRKGERRVGDRRHEAA